MRPTTCRLLTAPITIAPARRLARPTARAGRQVDFPSLRAAGRAGGRTVDAHPLCSGSGLPVDAGLPARGSASRCKEGPAGTVTLLGRGLRRLSSPSSPLDAGNSGTTMRLLAGIAGRSAASRRTLVGDASLSRRPMRRVIEPLERMGARIESTRRPSAADDSRAHNCTRSHTARDVPSAQVKSAVLLAGLHAEGTTSASRSRRRPAITPSAR